MILLCKSISTNLIGSYDNYILGYSPEEDICCVLCDSQRIIRNPFMPLTIPGVAVNPIPLTDNVKTKLLEHTTKIKNGDYSCVFDTDKGMFINLIGGYFSLRNFVTTVTLTHPNTLTLPINDEVSLITNQYFQINNWKVVQ